jgi:pyruvate/2-oxoglutarate dehydrogenase complex dihydrolipoamide acyltransferase (E2) component
MPTVPVTLPELGTHQVRFSLWYVRCGDRLYEGDRVAEVMIPGATFDVAAPAAGTLIEVLVHANDSITAGQVLGLIEAEEE